jgi:hypothetical protein
MIFVARNSGCEFPVERDTRIGVPRYADKEIDYEALPSHRVKQGEKMPRNSRVCVWVIINRLQGWMK